MVKSVNTIQKIAIKEGVGTNFCEYNRDLYKKLSLEKDEGRVKGGESATIWRSVLQGMALPYS